MNRARIRGFTLIELLVVISIIALLLSILMPALSKVKEAGKSVVCKNNLKTLHMAASLFAYDNNDWAAATSWSWADPVPGSTIANPGSLKPYTDATRAQENNNPYVCPSAKNSGFMGSVIPGDPIEPPMMEKTFTYGINGWISSALCAVPAGSGKFRVDGKPKVSPGTPGEAITTENDFGQGPNYVYWYEHGSTKISAIRNPASIVYYMDHEFYAVRGEVFNPRVNPQDLFNSYGSIWGTMTRWHGKKNELGYGDSNVAWVDGHVSKSPDGDNGFDGSVGSGFLSTPTWTKYFCGK